MSTSVKLGSMGIGRLKRTRRGEAIKEREAHAAFFKMTPQPFQSFRIASERKRQRFVGCKIGCDQLGQAHGTK